MENKYYSVDEATKMLPLTKAYCRDIKRCYQRLEILTERNRKLSKLTSISTVRRIKIDFLRNKIRNKIELITKTYDRWRRELKELYINICNAQFGRVDVPVYCNAMESVVLLCVTPETVEDGIEWHVEGENHEQARPYFEKVY